MLLLTCDNRATLENLVHTIHGLCFAIELGNLPVVLLMHCTCSYALSHYMYIFSFPHFFQSYLPFVLDQRGTLVINDNLAQAKYWLPFVVEFHNLYPVLHSSCALSVFFFFVTFSEVTYSFGSCLQDILVTFSMGFAARRKKTVPSFCSLTQFVTLSDQLSSQCDEVCDHCSVSCDLFSGYCHQSPCPSSACLVELSEGVLS